MSKSKSHWFNKREKPVLPLILQQARQEKYMADQDKEWRDSQGNPVQSVSSNQQAVATMPEVKLQESTDSLREQLKSAIVQGENNVFRLERDLTQQKEYLTGNRGALQLLEQLPAQGAGVFVKVPV